LAEISNPNQQGGQDGKSLMAIMVVFMAILLGAQYYHLKTNPPQQATKPASSPVSGKSAAATASKVTPVAAAVESEAPATAQPVIAATSETTTTIENKFYRIRFSNRGAQVVSWILKGPQFTDSQGKPLELVNTQAAKLFGYPLSFYTYDRTSIPISSVARSNRVVTATLSGNIPAGVSGHSVTISGVGDTSFDGTYIVTQTGANTLTYAQDYGDNASSSGGTLATVNGATAETLSRALFVSSP